MVSWFASDPWNSIEMKRAGRHFEASLGTISTWCMVNSPCRSKEHNVVLSTRSHSGNSRCTDIYLRRDKKGQSVKVETMVEAPTLIYSFMSHWRQKPGTWRNSHVAVEGLTEAHSQREVRAFRRRKRRAGATFMTEQSGGQAHVLSR
jgi:hypothetical protein